MENLSVMDFLRSASCKVIFCCFPEGNYSQEFLLGYESIMGFYFKEAVKHSGAFVSATLNKSSKKAFLGDPDMSHPCLRKAG